ncbi:Gfo/Idh/MocA family oxidoreductase [uncultured Bacteroides sp.]|uniref:Gfo/Idh/MocA family protein n=1 Tax=uncultured Bacteroides sp. TaxID=162156 RepID=UPI002AA8EB8F|nr:Gfo/Idh/MocA family oxidoreductase [uncultured Bacteroides sp.]
MKRIRFAVIGQGHIGKRHAEMIRRNPQAELVAVCDILSKEKLGLSGISEAFYGSVDELLANEKEIDVINICVPNGLHAEFALKALNSEKHVVIEKPMALSKRDAEQVLSRSKEVGRDVFCVMQNRYSPPSVWLKEVIDSRILGKLYSVQLNCFWNRDERYYKPGNWHGTTEMDGGTLFTQFSHFVDIMYWLFGDITNIKGSFQDFNHQSLTAFEDSGSVLFDFLKGGSGSLNYSTAVWDKNLESSLTIIAENGSVKVAGQYMNEVEYCHIKDYSMPKLTPSNPPNDYGAYKGSAQNHHYVIQNVIDKLNGNALITTNAMDGLKVVDIIERIYKERDTQ